MSLSVLGKRGSAEAHPAKAVRLESQTIRELSWDQVVNMPKERLLQIFYDLNSLHKQVAISRLTEEEQQQVCAGLSKTQKMTLFSHVSPTLIPNLVREFSNTEIWTIFSQLSLERRMLVLENMTLNPALLPLDNSLSLQTIIEAALKLKSREIIRILCNALPVGFVSLILEKLSEPSKKSIFTHLSSKEGLYAFAKTISNAQLVWYLSNASEEQLNCILPRLTFSQINRCYDGLNVTLINTVFQRVRLNSVTTALERVISEKNPILNQMLDLEVDQEEPFYKIAVAINYLRTDFDSYEDFIPYMDIPFLMKVFKNNPDVSIWEFISRIKPENLKEFITKIPVQERLYLLQSNSLFFMDDTNDKDNLNGDQVVVALSMKKTSPVMLNNIYHVDTSYYYYFAPILNYAQFLVAAELLDDKKIELLLSCFTYNQKVTFRDKIIIPSYNINCLELKTQMRKMLRSVRQINALDALEELIIESIQFKDALLGKIKEARKILNLIQAKISFHKLDTISPNQDLETQKEAIEQILGQLHKINTELSNEEGLFKKIQVLKNQLGAKEDEIEPIEWNKANLARFEKIKSHLSKIGITDTQMNEQNIGWEEVFLALKDIKLKSIKSWEDLIQHLHLNPESTVRV